MSKSFLIDVEKMIGKDKMEDYLKEINQDPFEEMKNQVKSMFSYLQDDDIVEILKKHNNNMDEAFDDFVNRNSEIEENKKRERQLEEERRKKEIHNKYIEQFVRNFQMFDKKEIEEAFKNNNNDPQLTSKQLYQMMKEREQQNEEAKKLKREIEIQNMCVGFLEKFGGLSKQEIIEVINQHDMDVEKISFELGKIQKQKIFDDLFIQYHNSFSPEEIRKTLDECNWSKIEAIKTFQNKIREKELELQKQRELEYQKQIELKQQKERELQLQLEIQKKREEELQKQKEYEIEREKELQKQKELEIQRQKEVELKKQQEIDRLCEIQKQKELDFQVQLEIQRQKELEFKKKIEEQEEKQRELERQLEIQKQKELDFQRELLEKQKELEKKKEEQKVEIPKLEYSQEQLQNLLEESKSKMIDVQKIIQEEEERKEEETKKNIENMILEYSNPEETPIKENVPQNECKIVIVEQDNKLVATVDFKSQTSYSWIGFYNKEDKDPNYKSYNYLCKLTEGKFVVDKPLLNGTYHFRVFLSGYISVGNSEDVIVSRKDVVTMARDEKNDKVTNVTWDMGSVDPVAVGAYVTIHKKEEERANYYRRWNWIKTFSGTHSFKTPIHTGEYEARVYFNGKVQFKSDIMKIEGI